MIASLRGTIIKKSVSGVVVEACGIGYDVTVPVKDLSKLPEEGSEIFLYIHTLVKEDAIELYGFIDEQRRRLFNKLLKLTGIGPKLALNILSAMEPEEFYDAVQKEDLSMLTSLPGIGKKTAQRLMFEMKQLLPEKPKPKSSTLYEDLVYALIGLGYTKSQAHQAVNKVYSDNKPLETLLKEALQLLSPVKDKAR